MFSNSNFTCRASRISHAVFVILIDFDSRLDQLVPDSALSRHEKIEDAKFQNGGEDEKVTRPEVNVQRRQVRNSW